MATFQTRRIGVPSMQRDGQAVILALECDGDQTVTLRILTNDLRMIAGGLLDAIDAAAVSQTLWDSTREDGADLKATPTVHQVDHLRFVSDPKSDLRYLALLVETGEEVLIGFQPRQVDELLARIQGTHNVQVSDAPPS